MTKQNILKSIVMLLSISIILCTYLIIAKILTKTTSNSGQPLQKEVNVYLEKKEKIKQFLVNDEKIYILTTTPRMDKIKIIDEKQAKEAITIRLIKGDKGVKNEQ